MLHSIILIFTLCNCWFCNLKLNKCDKKNAIHKLDPNMEKQRKWMDNVVLIVYFYSIFKSHSNAYTKSYTYRLSTLQQPRLTSLFKTYTRKLTTLITIKLIKPSNTFITAVPVASQSLIWIVTLTTTFSVITLQRLQ